MDTKIALDMEIAVYRRLLESEETRLGLLVDGEGNIIRLLANSSNTKCLNMVSPRRVGYQDHSTHPGDVQGCTGGAWPHLGGQQTLHRTVNYGDIVLQYILSYVS